MEVYFPKVIIGFDPQPDWNLTLGFQPVHFQAFSLPLCFPETWFVIPILVKLSKEVGKKYFRVTDK